MSSTVWLIRYTDRHGQPRAVAQLHNCVADYRTHIDQHATAQSFDAAALTGAAQAAADFSFEAAMQRGNYASALQEHCHIKRDLRLALGQASAAVDDGIQRGNADLVPAQHATQGTPA